MATTSVNAKKIVARSYASCSHRPKGIPLLLDLYAHMWASRKFLHMRISGTRVLEGLYLSHSQYLHGGLRLSQRISLQIRSG